MRRLTLSEFKQKDPFSTLNDVWVIYCGVILLTHFSLSLNYTCILTRVPFSSPVYVCVYGLCTPVCSAGVSPVCIFFGNQKRMSSVLFYFSLCLVSLSLIDSGGGLVASKLQQSSCLSSTHGAGVPDVHKAIKDSLLLKHLDPSSGPHAVQQALLPTGLSLQTLIIRLYLIG